MSKDPGKVFMRRNTTDFFGSHWVISALDLTESRVDYTMHNILIFSWYNMMEIREDAIVENLAIEFLIYLYGGYIC